MKGRCLRKTGGAAELRPKPLSARNGPCIHVLESKASATNLRYGPPLPLPLRALDRPRLQLAQRGGGALRRCGESSYPTNAIIQGQLDRLAKAMTGRLMSPLAGRQQVCSSGSPHLLAQIWTRVRS